MLKSTEVIKNGKREPEIFDRIKLMQSITSTCLATHCPIGQAEESARSIATDIERWIDKRPEITSKDIRKKVADMLYIHQPEAAYLYKQRNITI